jgi:drug/metabolite transporter (DMT)-like permease
MNPVKVPALTVLAMLAFAGNSLLCRMALQHTGMGAATFTAIRLASGALVLGAIAAGLRKDRAGKGHWVSAAALLGYAAGFSWAYLTLSAATGALLLFGAVQVTMIAHGLWAGERLAPQQMAGLALAFAGLVGLLLPGLSAPPLRGALLMLMAGIAWGVYSVRGKGAGDPTRVTAGNFWRATVLAAPLCLLPGSIALPSLSGLGYAVASGAITSGLGYAVWYAVLPALKASQAASIQLSVPVLAALGGVLLLGEPVTSRLLLTSLAILGGIALVVLCKPGQPPSGVVGSARASAR